MDCQFCRKNVTDVDFKDTATLSRFISAMGKIRPKSRTGLCAYHQRKTARAIKRARHLGLMSTSSK